MISSLLLCLTLGCDPVGIAVASDYMCSVGALVIDNLLTLVIDNLLARVIDNLFTRVIDNLLTLVIDNLLTLVMVCVSVLLRHHIIFWAGRITAREGGNW